MRSFFAFLRQLVLPGGAQPGTPRIVLGPDIPAELVAWGATHLVTFLAVTRYEFSATRYTWEAIGSFAGQITKFEGSYDPTNGVYITARTVIFEPPGGYLSVQQRIGSSTLNTFLLSYLFQQTSVEVQFDSELFINATNYQIDGVPAARGRFAQDFSAAASAVLGAEAVVASVGALNFPAFRAFRVDINAAIFGTSPVALYQIRRTNLAGAILWNGYALPNSAGFGFPGDEFGYLANNTAANINEVLVLTLQPLGGGTVQQFPVGAARTFTLTDIGTNGFWQAAPL